MGLDNPHLYQDLTPNGHSNSQPSQKNGHVPQGNAYEFEGETGQEVHEYEYPDAPVNSISGKVGKEDGPYGFGRQASHMFKGQTQRDRIREEKESVKHKSHCSMICAVLFAILILIIIGAIIFVVFEFIGKGGHHGHVVTRTTTILYFLSPFLRAAEFNL